MSEYEYDRCDAECEYILHKRSEEARRKQHEEDCMAKLHKAFVERERKMLRRVRQRQIAINVHWICTFMSGVFGALCAMYTHEGNAQMAVAAAVFCLISLFGGHLIEPHAYVGQGRWGNK